MNVLVLVDQRRHLLLLFLLLLLLYVLIGALQAHLWSDLNIASNSATRLGFRLDLLQSFQEVVQVLIAFTALHNLLESGHILMIVSAITRVLQ